jgi:hypothetical protein
MVSLRRATLFIIAAIQLLIGAACSMSPDGGICIGVAALFGIIIFLSVPAARQEAQLDLMIRIWAMLVGSMMLGFFVGSVADIMTAGSTTP